MEDVFCQNFTAGVPGIGETLTVPLKDDGEDIMVTEDNRREFVDLYVDYYLNNAIHKQVHAVAHFLWLHCCGAAYSVVVVMLLYCSLILWCSLTQLLLLWEHSSKKENAVCQVFDCVKHTRLRAKLMTTHMHLSQAAVCRLCATQGSCQHQLPWHTVIKACSSTVNYFVTQHVHVYETAVSCLTHAAV